MKLCKKIIAVVLSIVMVMGMISIDANAAAEPAKVKSISVSNLPANTLVLKVKKSFRLKVKVATTGKTSKKVTYKSTDDKVVKVSKNGKVKALKKGTAKVVIRSIADKKVKKTIKVVVGTPVTSIKAAKKKVTLYKGDTYKIKTTVSPTKASVKSLVYKSSKPSVAKVDSKGKVTAKKAGTAKITITAKDGSGKKAYVTVKVKNRAAKKITLSGKSDDSFVAKEDCYTEDDGIVMYFQKGITIKGDMLKIANKVMDDLCKDTGLNFNKNYDSGEEYEFMDMYFAPGIFKGINSDRFKINIVVADLGNGVEWAADNNAVFDQSDFDYDNDGYSALYHELAHVLQLRNGVDLGSVMNEGFATYTENKIRLSLNIPAWTAAQYYFPAEFDESLISGGEETFRYMFDVKDTNYQYGFRFVTYLYETYGEDIYFDILAKATKMKFDSIIYDSDNVEATVKAKSKQLLKIIKSVTTENVMSDFAKWYKDNWDALAQEYMEKVESLDKK